MRVEILLTDINVQLDISDFINTNLTYSFDDLTELNGRKSSGGINYLLPGTPFNKIWLGNIFDINSTFTYFNPNKKTSVKIIVDSNIILDGFMKLNKIIDTPSIDDIWFDVVFFDNVVDLKTELGDLTINDLSLIELNHDLTKQNIEASWNHNWEDGYVYPLYKGSDAIYSTKHFYPALFYKYVLEKTLNKVGFGATGSFLDDLNFNNEIIPYTLDNKRLIDENELNRRSFYVGIDVNKLQFDAGTISTTHTYDAIVVPYDNESSPFFDGDNNWSTTLYEWTVDRNGDYRFEYKFKFDINAYNPTSSNVVATNNFGQPAPFPRGDFEAVCQIWRGSSWNENWDIDYQIGWSVLSTIPSGTHSWTSAKSVMRNLSPRTLNIGNKVRIVVRLKKNVGTFNYRVGSTVVPVKLSLDFINISGGLSYAKNTPLIGDLTDGDKIDFSNWSDKIKLIDLISDIKTRHNLIIYPDVKNERLLHFVKWKDFFENAPRDEWSALIDNDYKENIIPLFNLKNKSIILSYKNNNDDYSKYFVEVVGQTHLYKKITFDNDFLNGEQRIETTFAESPLVKNPVCDIVSPAIERDLPKSLPTVQLWGGLITPPSDVVDNPWWAFKWIDNSGVQQTTVYNQFPYMGHFDNPWQPTYDIGFSQQPYYYIEPLNLTDNNLYNINWYSYIRNLEDGKLWKVKLKLTSNHVKLVRENPNLLVHINDKWFYISSINNFSPFEPLTECELIQYNEGVKFEPIKENSNYTNANTIGVIVRGEKNNEIGGGISIGDNWVDEYSIVVGSNNTMRNPDVGSTGSTRAPYTNISIGDNNIVGDNSYNFGDNNIVGDGGLNIGDNNFVAPGSYVIGGNGVISNPGDIWIGNNYIFNQNNGMVNYVDYYIQPDYWDDNYVISYTGSFGFNRDTFSINAQNIELNGNLTINGQLLKRIDRVSATAFNPINYDLDVFLVGNTGNNITINLPNSASMSNGTTWTFKDRLGQANTWHITVNADSGNVIDGTASYVMNLDYQSITITNFDTAWFII
jgi:hypothetical protein